MKKFYVTKEQVEMVLAHQYTQDDYTREVGPHKTTYNIINNHPEYQEAFWQTAVALEAFERQKLGNFDAIHLPDLMKHLEV
ncbi:hypothetical protein [Pseudomonas aeruginosa]|uniref:hypothetical protein n=1 Tax=Pseudomonas aeruginosa TaxID=287 RepID=UPI001024577F|nr:hypothetical protein PAZH1_28 [Pseudomonas phage PA_ZH1]BBI55898.1 hypothetical protein PALP01_0225 [Pseudomonas phage PA02]